MSARNRVLIVGRPGTGKLSLTKDLPLETHPKRSSHSGLSHELSISNKYYSTTIPIWVDEFGGHDSDSLEAWVEAFTSDEAQEVRAALAAVIWTSNIDQFNQDLIGISKFLRLLEDEEWDGLSFATLKVEQENQQSTRQEVEDLCLENGIEFIDIDSQTNSQGETDGINRIKEALEAFEWPINDDKAPGIEGSQLSDDREMLESYFDRLLRPEEEKIDGNDNDDNIDEKDVDQLDILAERLAKIRADSKNLSNSERQALAEELAKELVDFI